MRALIATGNPTDPVRLIDDAPEPSPASGEAVVAVDAFSLNRGECRRLLGAKPGWRPGWDAAGVVTRPAADGTGPDQGVRVAGLADHGAWAERVAIPTNRLAAMPPELPASLASTLPVAGMTALLALRRGGQLVGHRVAVTGATGGVGGFALQLAALSGAHTTAVISAPDRTGGLPSTGVDAVEVGLHGEEEPYDVILDSVGGALLADALRRVRHRGLVVTYGNSSGEPTTIDLSSFYGRNGAALSAFQLFSELAGDPPGGRHLGTLAALVVAGRLEVTIDVERPWTDAAEIARAFMDRRIRGKAVLTIT